MFFLRHVIAAAALAVMGAPAVAAPLSPGSVIFPTGTTSAADPDLAGTVINDNLITATFGGPLIIARYNVQNRVVRSTNLGSLIFAPRIRDPFNNGFASRFEIVAFRLTGFGDAMLSDVEFRTDGPYDKGPTSVSRSNDGDILTFRYGDPLLNDALNPPGVRDESYFPSIKTTATHFRNIGTMTLLGRSSDADPDDPLQSVTIRGIAVPAVIPLPASGVLLIGGLAGLGALARRRRRG